MSEFVLDTKQSCAADTRRPPSSMLCLALLARAQLHGLECLDPASRANSSWHTQQVHWEGGHGDGEIKDGQREMKQNIEKALENLQKTLEQHVN